MSNTSKGNLFTQSKDGIAERWDEAFGTSFVHHVIAGQYHLLEGRITSFYF
jgi:hypothetical protein